MDNVRYLLDIAVSIAFLPYSFGETSCGYDFLFGFEYYCPDGYHCCSETTRTCCPSATICTNGDTACLTIGAIIGPILGFIGLIACCCICIRCAKRRQPNQGTVMQPSAQMQPHVTNQNPGSQQFIYPVSQPDQVSNTSPGTLNQGFSK